MAIRVNTKLIVPQRCKAVLEKAPVEDPGPRQILVRNHYTLMNMGTEMCVFGAFPEGSWYEKHIRYPFWAGWGSTGEVVAVGDRVGELRVGDRVVTDAHHGTYGIEHVDHPEGPQKVPEGLSDEQAGLWSMSRVALLGIRRANINIGESVVIVGQGIVGQLTLRYAHLSGAYRLFAVDPSPMRLELGRRGGATHALEGPIEAFEEEIVRLNKGRKVDCVIECTGIASVFPASARIVRMGGRLVSLGSPRGTTSMDLREAIHPGVDLLGAHWSTYAQVETHHNPWTAARNGEVYLDLVQAGLMDVSGLISHTFNWREAPDAYQQILQDRTRFMAVRFDWRDCPDSEGS